MNPQCMIALKLPLAQANEMALAGHESPNDLHLTLAMVETKDSDSVIAAMQRWVETQHACYGTVAGSGRFRNQAQDVLYASYDCPTLSKLRQDLVELLVANGLAISMKHGFQPHITLAYLDSNLPDIGNDAPRRRLILREMIVTNPDEEVVASWDLSYIPVVRRVEARDWDENLHPRDEGGKFTDKSGGQSGKKTKPSQSTDAKVAAAEEGTPKAKALKVHETRLVELKDHEEAVVVDADGKVILEKVGEADFIDMAEEDIAALKGATITHNHPNGQGFSQADVLALFDWEAAEMRVVGQMGDVRYLYRLRPDERIRKQVWAYPYDLRTQMNRARYQARMKLRDRITDGSMTAEEAQNQHAHEMLLKVSEWAADYGDLGYSREVIEGSHTSEAFREEDHPRSEDGKFADKSGGKASSKPSSSTPSAAPKSKDSSPRIRELKIREKALAYVKVREESHVVDADGKVLLSKKGEADYISFTEEEVANFKGATLTHNHPAGASFSEEDMALLLNTELAEIRAVGFVGSTQYLYRFVPDDTVRAEINNNPLVYSARVRDAQTDTREAFHKRLEADTMTVEEATAQHSHEVWLKVAEAYKPIGSLGYSREVVEE